MPTSPSAPSAPAAKPATPVADQNLAEEVRRLSGYAASMTSTVEQIRDEVRLARKQMINRVSWGVFIALIVFTILAVVVGSALEVSIPVFPR